MSFGLKFGARQAVQTKTQKYTIYKKKNDAFSFCGRHRLPIWRQATATAAATSATIAMINGVYFRPDTATVPPVAPPAKGPNGSQNGSLCCCLRWNLLCRISAGASSKLQHDPDMGRQIEKCRGKAKKPKERQTEMETESELTECSDGNGIKGAPLSAWGRGQSHRL